MSEGPLPNRFQMADAPWNFRAGLTLSTTMTPRRRTWAFCLGPAGRGLDVDAFLPAAFAPGWTQLKRMEVASN